jgi:hypothetical protein
MNRRDRGKGRLLRRLVNATSRPGSAWPSRSSCNTRRKSWPFPICLTLQLPGSRVLPLSCLGTG